MSGNPLGARRNSAPRTVKFLGGVGDRQIRVIASDATPDRMGDVLEPSGCDLTAYRKNPVVLAQHDAAQPIARCAAIAIDGAAVVALIEFPPERTSERADEYLRLLKAGYLSAVSVGFLPLEWQPLKGGGLRFTRWEMLECSVVSVPANPSALVTERGFSNQRDEHLRRARAIKDRHRGTVTAAVHSLPDFDRAAYEHQEELARRARAASAARAMSWVQW